MKMPEPVATMQRGEPCIKSTDDDQSFGMWCPVSLPNGTNLYDKQALIDLLEEAAVDVMTHGKSDYPAVFAERLRKLKETL